VDKGQELQSLKRGLKAVAIINTLGSITIAELSRRLELPRTTAERVLMTLFAEGYIDRDPETKAFFLTAQVHALSDGYAEESRLVAAARPLLFETTRKIGWPLLLAMPMGEYMSVRVTSDAETTLGLNRRHIGSALPIALGSSGLVFLAFLDETQRELMVEVLRQSDLPEQSVVHDKTRFEYLIQKIRALGYGFGLDNGRERSIAVPVMLNGRVRGALLMTYMSRVLSTDAVVERYVGTLKELAAAIEQSAADDRPDEPPTAPTVRRGGAQLEALHP
jgi:IclR family transcriptional regulator, mhp operon transcriptional activator